jgi:sulfate transport system ATP-binding protein
MTLLLSHLSRHFADSAALDDVSLAIAPGEFLALLGSSGSGKTTLLRILAGLDYPQTGSVTWGGHDLLNMNARERKVGLVFQHYALFRHLNVTENIAFGLRVRPRHARPSRAEISERVEKLLKRVQLEGYGKRFPAQLSGGQRQRVALARALAVEPELLLLDEPFGALDAQVRIALRRWLRNLHEELGLTTVFVTHDQEEALELADRVAVMNRGRIEQVGTPEAIYQQPATPFVCEFIGKMNKFELRREQDRLICGALDLGADPWARRHDRAVAYIRPEHLSLTTDSGWKTRLRHIYLAGSIAHLELALDGSEQIIEVDVPSEDLLHMSLPQGAELYVEARTATVFPLLDGPGEAKPEDRRVLKPHQPA